MLATCDCCVLLIYPCILPARLYLIHASNLWYVVSASLLSPLDLPRLHHTFELLHDLLALVLRCRACLFEITQAHHELMNLLCPLLSLWSLCFTSALNTPLSALISANSVFSSRYPATLSKFSFRLSIAMRLCSHINVAYLHQSSTPYFVLFLFINLVPLIPELVFRFSTE